MATGEEKCEICGSYSRLKEAVVDGSTVSICPICAISHDALVIEKPTDEQLAGINRCGLRKEFEKAREEARKHDKLRNLGNVLREARGKAGMSQKEVAEAMAEPEKSIMSIELGQEKDDRLINRLKNFLRNRLRKSEENSPAQEEIDFRSKELKLSDLKKLKEEKQGQQ